MNIYNDLTFLMPIRIDSIIRVENLLVQLKLIRKLKAKTIVFESSSYCNHIIEKMMKHNLYEKYVFTEDKDPIFHRTKILNNMTSMVDTPFIAIWDVDVVVSIKQIECSMEKLRNEDADISFPYNGDFFDIGIGIRELFLKKPNYGFLLKNKNLMNMLYGQNFIGGGIIVNTKKYIEAGMENENFYGWGPEDLDRFIRWNNRAYKIHRAENPMFHLTHPRDENGRIRSDLQNVICNMNIDVSMDKFIKF